MELVESTVLKEQYLSLNMIVKNEGHIIKDTLTKLLKKVPAIDYWVISDTGSTDKTKEIISEFFKERNIKGELFDDEWKDFGHNRTKALEHAYKKSKYLLVFDADDEICGDFVLPDLKVDSYHFQFGDANGTSYTRTQIVNNKKKWKYVGVLHEIITCCEQSNGMVTIKGNYYTISGKSGSRSQDQNKYQKDALILEKAYEEAVKNNDDLYNRYGFYCANSYFDSGKHEDAIKWYKITLDNKNWVQEKYVACQRLYHCYNALNQKETGMFYLVKSFSYDKERAECLYELVTYYCCNDMNEVAYNYYNNVKSFYNERYLKDGLNNKLFLDVSKANLFLPYYMILVSDKVKDHDTTIQMYRIIFTKKHIEGSKHYIGNMLYNLQFFIERVKDDIEFLRLFQEYIEFLISIEYPIYDHDFMSKYEKYGINVPKFSEPVFSLDNCLKSKNILLYSGYSPFKWNYTFSINNALGGSETAITCLTKNFPKDYTIYVAGEVEEETVENIRYVHFNNLTNLIKTTAFHSIIVSRYLNFYELYKNFSAYQTFIWGHDITLYSYGTDLSVEGILSKWASKITGCICQTEWHKNLFLSSFPQLKDKISTINNGINADLFNLKDITKVKKVINRFIYTSCSERGLYKLLQLWSSILENLPEAELMISSYNNFPKSDEDNKILEIITKTPSIKHMGKLNKTELYNLMATAEYWLYPSYFQETSCITSLELLASEVICLYYPIAGLVNTVGDYGVPISEGNELDALLSLSIKKKTELKRKGKEYALSCSWKNRAIEWSKLLFLHNDSLNITNDKNQLSTIEKRMFDLYESLSMPQAHTNILKKISETFTPNVIYDIGASTLHWTKAAKNIWPNSEFCAFDAIEEAEKLYKSKNIKYNIGVISDQDNKIVKFYENKENPAGNSYYKEIGHPNSVNVYPENSYIERKSMTLETVVKRNNFLLPDLVKIDVQGAELDILKGGQTIINNAKYLIIELQNAEYNRGAPLENVTIEYLQSNGWEIVESKFSNNGPDADYLFINTNYRANKILNNDYIIKIVNLERRSDRKTDMINKLSEKMVNNYEFFEAVDGNLLEPSQNIKNLFKNNDFNYRKGIIGCALSHYELWNNLINDDKYSYYVILEDDIELVDNFNEYIEQSISIIQKQDIKYALIGGYQIKDQLTCDDIISFDKITQPICSGTFGYIISKEGCKVLVNYLNKNGINRAIDHSDLYTNCLDMYKINKYIVNAESLQIHGKNDTDIQFNYDYLNFENIPTYTVSFVDWWSEEYCGGTFDNHNNYFTKLLTDYYNVQIVEPNQNPDILFYSVFGNNHLNLNAKRKIFYTGEAISQDHKADFNITFDNDNDNNCRLPLWLCYLNDTIINDYNNKIQNKIEAPQKSKFCSIICQQDNVENTRSEIVNKLSKYKRVDCGGKFLNNIGYVVPKGINCSGKIEHNNNYKFAITFENKDYPGYVTEKICDAYKSNCIPIYWGTKDVVKDFNPSTFINANNFANFDELIDYIIKVDNDDKLYKTFFKEPIFSNKWLETFNHPNNVFFKNLVDNIIGSNVNFRNYIFEYGIDSNKKDITNIIVNILESTMQNFVIPIGDNMRAQLFGDPCWGHVKKIFIYNKNYPEQTIIVTENESKIIYFDEKYNYNFVMGFYDNGLSERGTTTMMFSYADYAEKYFKCKSIIFYNKHHHSNNNEVINRFSNRFDVYRVENFEEIDRIILDKNIKYLYNTCGGLQNSTPLVKNCKNLIHAVFDIEPFGDKYSAISDYIIKKSKYPDIDAIPYMIDLPIHNDNMSHDLNLPDNAFVIGRIGGYEQFDLPEAHKGIINFLNNTNNNSTYFVFVNTQQFYEHPQIIYLDKIVEPYLKVKYINTCNCMIHARSDGETFGLAIAEFSSLNKPVITCRSYKDNCHLDILGEKAIIFDSDTSLFNILKDIKGIVKSRDDWNAYKEYTPDKVMKKFMNVFMPEINNSSDNITFDNITFDNITFDNITFDNITFDNINYIDMKSKAPHFNNTKELVIVSAFLDINREKWSTSYKRTARDYILSFTNYFNYNTKMLVFIDDKYIDEIKEIYNNSSYNNTIFVPINNDWMTKHIYAWQLLDISKHIMQSDKYTNLVKDRIACGNPENIYADYNAINHSKIDFICYAINNNLINRDSFICWSDFGYFNSILHNNPSEYPNNHLDITKFNPNKLSFCLRNKLDNKDQDTIYTLVNAPEKFTGSFFSGPSNLMLKLQKLYHTSLKELYNNNISDDDQHIYLKCFLKEPNLFNLYLDSYKWPKGLCYFEKLPDRFELVKTLLSNIKNGKFVEIGCDRGTFSKYILTVNKTSTLYSVDPYISYDNYIDSINYVTGDNLYNETNMKLTQEFGDRFKLIREFSNKACNLVSDNLNFVYIDGNHQYEYVYEDLCLWWEKLAPNGIIVGDDAVDTDETKRDKNGDIFIEWCPGSYGKYGVIHAFNRFISEKKCYGQIIGNQFVLFK